MGNPQQLPYLLELLDDETPAVRQAVLAQLRELGSERDLEELLDALKIPLNSKRRRQVHNLLNTANGPAPGQSDLTLTLAPDVAGDWLRRGWSHLADLDDDVHRLETGLGLLSGFLRDTAQTAALSRGLDSLEEEFLETTHPHTPLGLSRFLFQDYGLTGSASKNYYRPENSDLVYVMEEREGIPISLCCIYMLVGERLGLQIHGCNLPRHFMAHVRWGSQTYLVDCYNGGKVLSPHQMDAQTKQVLTREYLADPPRADDILHRFLRNLHAAFSLAGAEEKAGLVMELASDSPEQ